MWTSSVGSGYELRLATTRFSERTIWTDEGIFKSFNKLGSGPTWSKRTQNRCNQVEKKSFSILNVFTTSQLSQFLKDHQTKSRDQSNR